MIFTALELHNFGVYKDEVIDLEPPSAEKPIIIFGGLNGAGKTTLLEAIQLCLYGKRAQTPKREGLGYEEYLRRCIHHGVSERDGAGVRLTFLLKESGEERRLSVSRDWHTAGSGIKETLQIWNDGEVDDRLTQQWDEYIDGILPVGVSHLFFFDGEQIERFADLTNSDELLRIAIYALLGLNLVQRLTVDLKVLEKRKAKSLANPEQLEELKKAELKLTEAQQSLAEMSKLYQHDKEELIRAEAQRDEAEGIYRAEGGELYEELGELEEKLSFLQGSVEEVKEAIRVEAAGASPLLLVRDLLKEIQKEDLFDQERETAAVLSSTLEQREDALSEFGKSEGIESDTLDRVLEFLRQDRQNRQEKSAGDVVFDLSRESRGQLSHLLLDGLSDAQETLQKLCKNLRDQEEERDATETLIQSVPQGDALEKISKDRNQARERVAECETKLLRTQLEKELRARELERETKEYEKSHGRIVEHELDDKYGDRVVQFSQRSRVLLDEFQSAVLQHNVSRIQHHVLESFQYLLRKEGLVHDIQIDPATLVITLMGDKGQTVHPDRLSAGERQILATSLLWGMAKASQRVLPVVIDTPLGRLDSVHRDNLVRRYFPNASHQVILLSTDEEIGEGHLERLEERTGRTYHLDFDDTLQRTSIHEGYFPAKVPA